VWRLGAIQGGALLQNLRQVLHTFDDGEKICTDNGSTLIEIRFKEEQDFLVNYLFSKNKIVDNVWLSAKFTINKYKWQDGAELIYNNWAVGSPKNATDHCVQLDSEEGLVGKWIDGPCQRKNLVVCQKKQVWSIARLQENLLKVMQNPVPIGFIYVQLPSEKSPTEVWSRMMTQ